MTEEDRNDRSRKNAIYAGAEYILAAVIICAFCKTVLQTVLPIKRFTKSFYKSAIYAGGQ
jgi:hypothetical protein